MATAAQPAQPSDYDEAQCIAALAQLERLQNQLDDLRLTLPRIVEPFHMPSRPPMYHAFKDNVIKAQREMKAFKSQWQSQDTQGIFEHTKNSAIANPDLSAGAHVWQYGWIEKEQRSKEAAKKDGDEQEKTEDAKTQITKEERERIVGGWRNSNPSVHAEEKDEGRELSISFGADSLNYRFRVTISDDANTTQAIKAECEGTREPFVAVTRCLESRPNQNDLQYVLDMITAYKTVKGLKCAKCERMLDDDATRPVARRSRQVAGPDESSHTVWEPFHESCLV